jgi:hypothetical protein
MLEKENQKLLKNVNSKDDQKMVELQAKYNSMMEAMKNKMEKNQDGKF